MDLCQQLRLVDSEDPALVDEELAVAVDPPHVVAGGGVHQTLDGVVDGGDAGRLEVEDHDVGLGSLLEAAYVRSAEGLGGVEGGGVECLGGGSGGPVEVDDLGEHRGPPHLVDDILGVVVCANGHVDPQAHVSPE